MVTSVLSFKAYCISIYFLDLPNNSLIQSEASNKNTAGSFSLGGEILWTDPKRVLELP